MVSYAPQVAAILDTYKVRCFHVFVHFLRDGKCSVDGRMGCARFGFCEGRFICSYTNSPASFFVFIPHASF